MYPGRKVVLFIMLGFIPDDGYCEPFFIAAVERLHPALRGTFRPMRIDDRARWGDGVNALPAEERIAKTAEALAGQLVSWDLRDRTGQPLIGTVERIRTLKPALYDRLFSIVWGYSPSDIDPQWPQESKAALAADVFPRGS